MRNELGWSGWQDGDGWDVELGGGVVQDALLDGEMEQEVGLGVLGGSAGCSE